MSYLKLFQIVDIITEIVNKCPLLMNIMYSISIKDSELMSGEHCDPKMFPKWALVYGILMQHNYHELSFMQHVVTAIMEDSLCDQKACKLYVLYCFYTWTLFYKLLKMELVIIKVLITENTVQI